MAQKNKIKIREGKRTILCQPFKDMYLINKSQFKLVATAQGPLVIYIYNFTQSSSRYGWFGNLA